MNYYFFVQILSFLIIFLLFYNCYKYHRQEKIFDKLMSHINVGYCKYRLADRVIISTNMGFIKILELDIKVNDVIGKSLSELMIYIDEEEFNKKLLKYKEISNYEYRFKTLNGRNKVILHNAYLEKDPSTGELVVEDFIEDITEERLSYEKMKESEERYEKLFRNSGDIVVICKFDSLKIEEINPVTQVILGYSDKELMGKSILSLIHPYNRKAIEAAQKDLLFKGASRIESVVVCKSGIYKEMFITLTVVEIKEDQKIMAVLKDVSSLVKDREEQKRRNEDLEKFWQASMQREERIKDIKEELDKCKAKLKALKDYHGRVDE